AKYRPISRRFHGPDEPRRTAPFARAIRELQTQPRRPPGDATCSPPRRRANARQGLQARPAYPGHAPACDSAAQPTRTDLAPPSTGLPPTPALRSTARASTALLA